MSFEKLSFDCIDNIVLGGLLNAVTKVCAQNLRQNWLDVPSKLCDSLSPSRGDMHSPWTVFMYFYNNFIYWDETSIAQITKLSYKRFYAKAKPLCSFCACPNYSFWNLVRLFGQIIWYSCFYHPPLGCQIGRL